MECTGLSISDTGTGIDSSILDKIFDPYFTTKEVGKGSGMGLAMVHGIVKSNNGYISVQSEPMKKTTFTILFPVSDIEPDSEENQNVSSPTGNEKILLIDDEEALAKMATTMLKRLGYDVIYQTDSLQALELIKEDPEDKFPVWEEHGSSA